LSVDRKVSSPSWLSGVAESLIKAQIQRDKGWLLDPL